MTTKAPFFRTPYNYDRKAASDEGALDQTGQESLTVQSDRDDCDLNVIISKHGLMGVVPENHRIPQFGDFTGVGDYASALAAVRAAQENFGALPAQLRSRFENDPQKFLLFCSDTGNLPEMVELGLAVKRPVVDNPPGDKPVEKVNGS